MIGIIPAAGKAERMHGLPKMLLPTPQGVLIDILIRRIQRCQLEKLVVLPGILNYAGLVSLQSETISVYSVGSTNTMCETLLSAPDYARMSSTMFGMPDSYFEDDNAFVKLAAELDAGADVAVGVFYTRPEQRHKLGMVEIAGDEVLHVIDKPATTDLIWAWGVLAWKPRFWDLLDAADPHVGYALPRALAAGLDVRAVKMSGGYWDCGTPEEYFDLISHLHHPMHVVVTA